MTDRQHAHRGGSQYMSILRIITAKFLMVKKVTNMGNIKARINPVAWPWD